MLLNAYLPQYIYNQYLSDVSGFNVIADQCTYLSIRQPFTVPLFLESLGLWYGPAF